MTALFVLSSSLDTCDATNAKVQTMMTRVKNVYNKTCVYLIMARYFISSSFLFKLYKQLLYFFTFPRCRFRPCSSWGRCSWTWPRTWGCRPCPCGRRRGRRHPRWGCRTGRRAAPHSALSAGSQSSPEQVIRLLPFFSAGNLGGSYNSMSVLVNGN